MNVLSDTDLRTCLRLHREPIVRLTEDENWWRIGIIGINKKHALFRAGFGAPIVASTKFVLQSFDVDDLHGLAIILLTGGKPTEHFAGWVSADRAAEAQQWIDVLNAVIQAVLRPIEQHVAALRFESGSENAPDAPFGLETLELTESGALAYERRRGDVRTPIVGNVDPARFQQVVSALKSTAFPSPPQARFAPGASVVRITTMPSQQNVSVSYFEALRMEGYSDVVRELSKLVEALRDSKAETLAAWKFSTAANPAPG